jgi:hypothetical protein
MVKRDDGRPRNDGGTSLECKTTSEDMESKAENHEVPKEHATVETDWAPNKLHRGLNLAAGYRGDPKDQTWGNCGAPNELAVTGRKMTCHAGVAWCKGNSPEKLDQGRCWTRNAERAETREEIMDVPGRQQGNKGPRWQLATISKEGEDIHKQHQRVKLRTVSTSGKQRNTQEDCIWDLWSENQEKKIVGTSIRMQKMMDWSLRRGHNHSKTEKETAHRAGSRNEEAPATLGVTPHRGGTNRMMVRTWSD